MYTPNAKPTTLINWITNHSIFCGQSVFFKRVFKQNHYVPNSSTISLDKFQTEGKFALTISNQLSGFYLEKSLVCLGLIVPVLSIELWVRV